MRDSADPAAPGPTALGLDPAVARAGLGLAGVLSPQDYDARVAAPWRTPTLLAGARCIVVLATGGSAFFRGCMAAPEAATEPDPLDAVLARVVRAAVAYEQAAGYDAASGLYFERREGHFVDLVSLGQAAGLGAPSRLGILLHREYGPWMSIRAVLASSRPLAASDPDCGFSPCAGCAAPCVAACPGAAVGDRAFDFEACFETSARVPACGVGCAARRACVVGPAHAYDGDAEAWHRRAALGSSRAGRERDPGK